METINNINSLKVEFEKLNNFINEYINSNPESKQEILNKIKDSINNIEKTFIICLFSGDYINHGRIEMPTIEIPEIISDKSMVLKLILNFFEDIGTIINDEDIGKKLKKIINKFKDEDKVKVYIRIIKIVQLEYSFPYEDIDFDKKYDDKLMDEFNKFNEINIGSKISKDIRYLIITIILLKWQILYFKYSISLEPIKFKNSELEGLNKIKTRIINLIEKDEEINSNKTTLDKLLKDVNKTFDYAYNMIEQLYLYKYNKNGFSSKNIKFFNENHNLEISYTNFEYFLLTKKYKDINKCTNTLEKLYETILNDNNIGIINKNFVRNNLISLYVKKLNEYNLDHNNSNYYDEIINKIDKMYYNIILDGDDTEKNYFLYYKYAEYYYYKALLYSKKNNKDYSKIKNIFRKASYRISETKLKFRSNPFIKYFELSKEEETITLNNGNEINKIHFPNIFNKTIDKKNEQDKIDELKHKITIAINSLPLDEKLYKLENKAQELINDKYKMIEVIGLFSILIAFLSSSIQLYTRVEDLGSAILFTGFLVFALIAIVALLFFFEEGRSFDEIIKKEEDQNWRRIALNWIRRFINKRYIKALFVGFLFLIISTRLYFLTDKKRLNINKAINVNENLINNIDYGQKVLNLLEKQNNYRAQLKNNITGDSYSQTNRIIELTGNVNQSTSTINPVQNVTGNTQQDKQTISNTKIENKTLSGNQLIK